MLSTNLKRVHIFADCFSHFCVFLLALHQQSCVIILELQKISSLLCNPLFKLVAYICAIDFRGVLIV